MLYLVTVQHFLSALEMGRPSRKPIDTLRTQVWYEEVRSILGLTTAYQMDERFGTGTDRNWYKYQRGSRIPTHATLAAVERIAPTSRLVFEVGPEGVGLWLALFGPHDQLWGVIDAAFPEYEETRKAIPLGLLQYRNFLDKKFIPPYLSTRIDYVEWQQGDQPNAVMLGFLRNEISISIADTACAIAYWRLSNLVAFDMLFANYLLAGVESIFEAIYGKTVSKMLLGYTRKYLR